ncbi:MFS transporter [Streptomyces sp. GXMU-J15]|uniref:MFS transporter n=1 Tax=Streptomyces fuscus TaxID=3048495 RepID=A0ABT7J057_9ACTN|nr:MULTISPECIES: MFS transporter [Streptomyces]MDL2078202.1 MFS transporter [Streptomyces fuscus]SBT95117.1 Predicted arabinose efflux permease, MFS family [Streptomyces sp. DI166]
MGTPSLPRERDEDIEEADPSASPVSRRYAWIVFALAFALALTDFIDRQIIVAAFPYLRKEWGLSDTQLGALMSVVSVTVALGALPLARLADRWSRVKSIALMGSAWSVAALGCAVSTGYAPLVAARAALGVGEAGYGPAGGALIAGMFPRRLRATLIGALQAAAPLGAVIGVVFGSLMMSHLGWRTTLAVFAAPGLLLALLFLRVRDPHNPARAGAATAPTVGVRAVTTELFRSRTAVSAYFGGALQLVVLSTLYAWLPSYLTAEYDYSEARAGAVSAVAIIASAFGTVVLGNLADRAGAARSADKLRVPALVTLAALVLLTVAFAWIPPGPLQLCLIVAGTFCVTSAVGPVPAVVIDVVSPAVRASAIGMVALVNNLFGLAVGPLLTGWLSDTYGLPTALALMPLCCAASAAALWHASRTYGRDLNQQPDNAPPTIAR